MHEQDSARRGSARFAYKRFGSLLVVGEAAAAQRLDDHGRLGLVSGRGHHERVDACQALLGGEWSDGLHRRTEPELLDPRPQPALVAGVLWKRGQHEPSPPWANGVGGQLLHELEQALLGDHPAERTKNGRPPAAPIALPESLKRGELRVEQEIVGLLHHDSGTPLAVEAAGVPVIVRSSVWSSAYEGLPVLGYDSDAALAGALERLPGTPATPSAIAERFGPEQFMAALMAAPSASSPR